jgi:CheY-like chemotaxis protein
MSIFPLAAERTQERRFMQTPIRPPPKVLLIHDGTDVEAHFQHLTGAGLRVSKAHGEDAVASAIRLQPDIIVLDFRCNGEIMARLKDEPATRQIPVIALAELGPDADANESY